MKDQWKQSHVDCIAAVKCFFHCFVFNELVWLTCVLNEKRKRKRPTQLVASQLGRMALFLHLMNSEPAYEYRPSFGIQHSERVELVYDRFCIKNEAVCPNFRIQSGHRS